MCGPASAQLLLPGAVQQSPLAAGQTAPNPAGAVPTKPKPVELKPPSEETILGHQLSLDGESGVIAFQRGAGKGIEITRLSLAGEQLSHRGEACRVDVVADSPIQAKLSGRPDGLSHYEVDIAACPFSFDVLNGAIMVRRVPPGCDFPAADCRIAVAGLWGPPGKSFGPDQVKQFERERGHAETSLRTSFHALLTSTGKDKEAVKKIASEQAGFSSARDETCRKYLGEDVHGFCALRITQARIFALKAAFEERAKLHPMPAKALAKKTAVPQKPAPIPKVEMPQTPPPSEGPQ